MATPPPYAPDPDRYAGYEHGSRNARFRRCGRSGLDLPAISLGLWHNFGDDRPLETQRAILLVMPVAFIFISADQSSQN